MINQQESTEESQTKTEILVNIIREIMTIDQMTLGHAQDDYMIRFEGLLTRPSEDAYDFAAQALHPYQITPLFRFSGDKHAVLLRKGVFQSQPQKIRVNILLFFATFISIIFAGMLTTYDGPETIDLSIILPIVRENLGLSLAFAVSIFSILIAHEFGHYFAARFNNTKVTLPFFIPLPISPIGTMGAWIRFLEPPKNKRVLLDIGLAGPLAGLVIAIPVLIYGLSLSKVDFIPLESPEQYFLEGNSLLYLGLKYLIYGSWLPEPASYHGLHPILYWIRYFFTGIPIPKGGIDVIIHPIAWAGWAGLLVTSINLLPAGQLDGGHLIYCLFGDKSLRARPVILVILLLLGIFWWSWWLWAFLIFFLGRMRAEPLDEITDLDLGRKIIALFGLIVMVLVFTPVPLIIF